LDPAIALGCFKLFGRDLGYELNEAAIVIRGFNFDPVAVAEFARAVEAVVPRRVHERAVSRRIDREWLQRKKCAVPQRAVDELWSQAQIE